MLVDDWENVTKSQQLVPLPHAHPVNEIITDYLNWERPSRQPGSHDLDILEETMAGIREYFDKALGRILLYRWVAPPPISIHQKLMIIDSSARSISNLTGSGLLRMALTSVLATHMVQSILRVCLVSPSQDLDAEHHLTRRSFSP